jgi:hypothetical protein
LAAGTIVASLSSFSRYGILMLETPIYMIPKKKKWVQDKPSAVTFTSIWTHSLDFTSLDELLHLLPCLDVRPLGVLVTGAIRKLGEEGVVTVRVQRDRPAGTYNELVSSSVFFV